MKRPSLAASMKAIAEDTAPDPVALIAKARAPGVTPKATAPSREGMKRLLTPITPSLHKRLKMLAVKNETTLEAITREALEAYLSKQDSN